MNNVLTERTIHAKKLSRGGLEAAVFQKVLSKQFGDFVSRLDCGRRFPVQQHSTHSGFTWTQIPACIAGSGTFTRCSSLLCGNQHKRHCLLRGKVTVLHNMLNMIVSQGFRNVQLCLNVTWLKIGLFYLIRVRMLAERCKHFGIS